MNATKYIGALLAQEISKLEMGACESIYREIYINSAPIFSPRQAPIFSHHQGRCWAG